MDDLIKLVCERAQLSPEQSKASIDVVVGYLKTKLPSPIAGQIDTLLTGSVTTTGMGETASKLAGVFGRK